MIASTTGISIASSTTISILTFGTKSIWYSAPRYTSVWPRWRPNPRDSVTVMPWTPASLSASFTSSNLNGLTTAVMSFISPSLNRLGGLGRTPLRCADLFGTKGAGRRMQDEVRVARGAELRHVEAFDLRLSRDAHLR